MAIAIERVQTQVVGRVGPFANPKNQKPADEEAINTSFLLLAQINLRSIIIIRSRRMNNKKKTSMEWSIKTVEPSEKSMRHWLNPGTTTNGHKNII